MICYTNDQIWFLIVENCRMSGFVLGHVMKKWIECWQFIPASWGLRGVFNYERISPSGSILPNRRIKKKFATFCWIWLFLWIFDISKQIRNFKNGHAHSHMQDNLETSTVKYLFPHIGPSFTLQQLHATRPRPAVLHASAIGRSLNFLFLAPSPHLAGLFGTEKF